MEDNLNAFDSKLFYALSKSSDDVYFYHADTKKDNVYWSDETRKNFGLPENPAPMDVWIERIHPDDLDGFMKNIEELFAGVTPYHNCEYRIRNYKDEYVWVNCRGYMMYDEDGKPDFFAGFVLNMGQITKISPVTDMWNEYVFQSELKEIMKDGEEGGVMLLDIRNFKNINSKYGYEFGDSVLYTIGQKLVIISNERANIYHMGGPQFAITMKGSKEELSELYDDIIKYMDDINVKGQSLHIELSCGATLFPQDGKSFDVINNNLSYAIANAKQKRDNDIVFFTNEVFEQRNRIIRMNEALRRSIANNFEGFYLVMQPVLDAENGEIHSAESLLRWENEEFGKVSPMEFVPLLEQSGDIIPVGKWIIDKAFSYLAKWNELNPENKLPHINVNFSYIQLSDEKLKDYILEKLDEYNLPHDTLVAELTESCRVYYTDKLAEIMQSFRDEGITIALDDFGTGYASLMLLKDVPTDIVKLDHSMMRTIQDHPKDRTLVEFIIKYCREIDIDVCAEGVENEEIQEIVKAAGTALVQGYYYDKPLEAEEFFDKYLSK